MLSPISLFLTLTLLHPLVLTSPAPTRYSLLQKIDFPSSTRTIAEISSGVGLLFVGFGGTSSNVSVYIMNSTEPDPSLVGKKGVSIFYTLLQNLTEAKSDVTSISIKSEFGLVAVASRDNLVRTYTSDIMGSSINFKLRQELNDSDGPVDLVKVSDEGSFIATYSSDGSVRIYYNETIKPTNTPATNTTQTAPNSTIKTTVSGATSSDSWKYTLCQTIDVDEDVGSVAFAFNESTLYLGIRNGSVNGYHLDFSKISFEYNFTITDTSMKITSIALSKHGNILVTGSEDSFVRIYKTDIFMYNPRLVQGIYEANKAITRIHLRRDSQLLVASSRDGLTRVYNTYGDQFVLNNTFESTLPTNSMGTKGEVIVVSGNETISLYQSCISSTFQCSLCRDLNSCDRCLDNYYLSKKDGLCHSCPMFSGCKTCISLDRCTSCYSGYYLETEKGNCQACSSNIKHCKSCDTKFVCTECFPEFDLALGMCVFSDFSQSQPVDKTPTLPLSSPAILSTNIGKVQNPAETTPTDSQSQKWVIALIVLTIVVCVMIIVLLILLTLICVKLSRRTSHTVVAAELAKEKAIEDEIPIHNHKTPQPNTLSPSPKKEDRF